MEKYGIDWIKVALAVNDERKKAILDGTKPAEAFNVAYRAVTCQYHEITGEAWKEGRRIVGTIMTGWKKEKDQTAKAKKTAEARSATKITKKKSAAEKGEGQGELDL